MFLICFFPFKVWCYIVTPVPKYFADVKAPESFIIGILFFVTDSTWHLSGWNFIINFSSQRANLSKSSWICICPIFLLGKLLILLQTSDWTGCIPVLPVFADARNNISQAFVTCMLCQKKLNICINKILIYNRKWFRPFISSQTHSKQHNYHHVCTMLIMMSPIFGGWENLTRGDH